MAKQRYTPEQYLVLEREADHRSEYLSGEIFAMAGASPQHNRITANVVSALTSKMRSGPYQAFVSGMRVRVKPTGLYTYPDVVTVCGRPEHDPDDCLLNPDVILEVLSLSTEVYDRGEKFAHYRTLDSLREYVLIAQDKRRVERFVRQENGQWLLSITEDGSVDLAAAGCTLDIDDIYDKVEC